MRVVATLALFAALPLACASAPPDTTTAAHGADSSPPTCEELLYCNAPRCSCPQGTRCVVVDPHSTRIGRAECVAPASAR